MVNVKFKENKNSERNISHIVNFPFTTCLIAFAARYSQKIKWNFFMFKPSYIFLMCLRCKLLVFLLLWDWSREEQKKKQPKKFYYWNINNERMLKEKTLNFCIKFNSFQQITRHKYWNAFASEAAPKSTQLDGEEEKNEFLFFENNTINFWTRKEWNNWNKPENNEIWTRSRNFLLIKINFIIRKYGLNLVTLLGLMFAC